ncbi:hypothetical protein KC347_g138 [Hortaea werneckii]|nr:hypothetical protein KC347_g138 [Hortaea werneckii]
MAAIDTKLLKCMVKGSVEDLGITSLYEENTRGINRSRQHMPLTTGSDGDRIFSLVGKSKRLYRGGRLWEVMYERLPDLHGKCGNGLLSIVSFSASSD